MKNYAKIGSRQGRPAYRTQASFKYRRYLKTVQQKLKNRYRRQDS